MCVLVPWKQNCKQKDTQTNQDIKHARNKKTEIKLESKQESELSTKLESKLGKTVKASR